MAVPREDIETYKILMRGGEPRKALDHLKSLLMVHGTDQSLLAVTAPLALKLGDDETAQHGYSSLLDFSDLKAPDLFNIGYALRTLGKFELSIEAYKRAIKAGLTQAEDAYQNMGVILADELQDLTGAKAAFRQAIALKPSNLGPYINLGNLYEETGEFEKAVETYDTAHRNVDNPFEALARLSNAHEYESLNDPLLNQLLSAVESPQASNFDKECLHFALGTALDALGQYERAWPHFSSANAHGGKHGQSYDAAGTENFVSNILTQYQPKTLPSEVRGENRRPTPVFICGMFRSGSTLIEQILSAHPDFTPLGECSFIPKAAQTEPGFYPSQSAKLSAAECQVLRKRYYQQAAVAAVDTDYFTDKRPDNLIYIGLIKQVFPDAKIIFTDRNSRDNYLSIFFTQFGDGQAYARKIEDISHYHHQQKRLVTHWQSLFSDDIMMVNYDALIAEPENQVRHLLSRLNAPWSVDCLAFHTQRNRVKTASYKQVRRPFYSSSSGRWKHYEKWTPPIDF